MKRIKRKISVRIDKKTVILIDSDSDPEEARKRFIEKRNLTQPEYVKKMDKTYRENNKI